MLSLAKKPPVSFTQLTTSLHLPFVLVVRLRLRKIDVVILTPGWFLSSSLSFSIQEEAKDVARSAPQEAHYYHVEVIY